MSCSESAIYIYRGKTWDDVAFDYQDAASVAIPLTGYKARGALLDASGTEALALTSTGGTPNLIIDATAGTITPNVGSDATPSLPVGSLTLSIEIYNDAVSPPVVHPFIESFPVVVKADTIP